MSLRGTKASRQNDHGTTGFDHTQKDGIFTVELLIKDLRGTQQ
ncbi:MAG TPA: hypothetical protein VFA85_02350 [Terriglobales bacterium]|nr:hypothetical protein [Terriglobales bacterium]